MKFFKIEEYQRTLIISNDPLQVKAHFLKYLRTLLLECRSAYLELLVVKFTYSKSVQKM